MTIEERNDILRSRLGQNSLPREEYIENCKRGAQKSIEVRRKKKAMREIARAILDMPLKDTDEIREELKARGIDQTEAAAVLLAQLNRARAGDTEAARFIRDTSGQKPVDNVAIGNLDDRPFSTLDLSALSDDQLRELVAGSQEEDDKG